MIIQAMNLLKKVRLSAPVAAGAVVVQDICVTSSGEELCSFSREHMAPGEMEHIVLPKRLLERAGDGKLTVSLAAERGAKE